MRLLKLPECVPSLTSHQAVKRARVIAVLMQDALYLPNCRVRTQRWARLSYTGPNGGTGRRRSEARTREGSATQDEHADGPTL